MNPTDTNESQETDGDESGETLFPTPSSSGDARRLNDEIGIPSVQATGGLAGDAESGNLSDDVESGGP